MKRAPMTSWVQPEVLGRSGSGRGYQSQRSSVKTRNCIWVPPLAHIRCLDMKSSRFISNSSTPALTSLCDELLVESLLARRLLLLDARIFIFQLIVRMLPHDFTKYCLAAILASESGTEEVGRAFDNLAYLRVLGSLGPEGLLLMFGIENSTHAENLPVPPELRREDCFREVKPVRTGGVLRPLLAHGYRTERSENCRFATCPSICVAQDCF